MLPGCGTQPSEEENGNAANTQSLCDLALFCLAFLLLEERNDKEVLCFSLVHILCSLSSSFFFLL